MQSSSGRAMVMFKVVLLVGLLATAICVVIFIIPGARGEYVQAQEGDPEPQINDIQLNGSSTSSVTVTYPAPATVRVCATNIAATVGYGGGIYLSFPEFDSQYHADRVDWVNLWTTSGDDDLEYYEYLPGYSTIRYECSPEGYFDKAQNLLVAGYAPSEWESGEEICLEVKVSPSSPGTYQVYARAGVLDSYGICYNEPTDGAYMDQQCLHVHRRTIDVGACASSVYLPMVFRNYTPQWPFPPRQPYRAVWTQASSCSNASRCDSRLDCLEAAGATRIYYSIYYQQAYYSSDLMGHRDFDSLAYLVAEAHARDMEVYAGIPSSYMGWPEHPEWNARWNHAYVTSDWLDFAMPEARDFLADVAGEIVQEYDVDGIVLDLTRWHESWYRSADLSAEDITLTVQGINDRIEAVRPVALSAAVSGDHDYAERWRGQEWHTWLDEGYVDHVEAMSYVTDEYLLDFLDEWEDSGHFPGRIAPLLATMWFEWNSGHSVEEPKTAQEVLHQIDLCYDSGAVGIGLFDDRYTCTKVPGLVEALGDDGW
jgi:hypothetical protein